MMSLALHTPAPRSPTGATIADVADLCDRPVPHAHPPQRRPRPGWDACIDHPSGFLALSTRNDLFFAPNSDGFVAYRRQGRHLFLFGGVHAPSGQRAALLDAFLQHATAQRFGVVAVQIRTDQIDLFSARGFTVNPLGTSFGLRLRDYSLRGTRRMKLRNKIRRAQGLGIQIFEVGRDLPRDPATWAILQSISTAWLRHKGKKELDFMIGELPVTDDPADPHTQRRRIFVAAGPPPDNRQDCLPIAALPDRNLHALGFITYVPASGAQPGYLHDLTRRVPTAPPGCMELCNAHAIDRLRAEGVPYLHFGFTPFVVPDVPLPAGGSRLLARLITLLARHGSFVYPAHSQADYKRKWGPDVIDAEYVAARPLSVRAIWDLLQLTRSI